MNRFLLVSGETDVLLTVQTDGGPVAVMIEDKIGAQMQPRQCERYHERGQALCAEGNICRYTVVLCAPSLYVNSPPPEGGGFRIITRSAPGGRTA